MKTINYKGQDYKCEITSQDTNAIRVRVYDVNNVGNLYIWTHGYPMPKPYQYNRSKLIVKNVVLLAFKTLMARDIEDKPEKPKLKPRGERGMAPVAAPATDVIDAVAIVEDTIVVADTNTNTDVADTVEKTVGRQRKTTLRRRFDD